LLSEMKVPYKETQTLLPVEPNQSPRLRLFNAWSVVTAKCVGKKKHLARRLIATARAPPGHP